MASLVNYVGKTCQPGEITRNFSLVWYRYGGNLANILFFESNSRNVRTYYVNS